LLKGNNVWSLSYGEILETIKLMEKMLNVSLGNGRNKFRFSLDEASIIESDRKFLEGRGKYVESI
jgi:hypothetical protein